MRRFYQFLCGLNIYLVSSCSALVTEHNCPYKTADIQQLKSELSGQWHKLGHPRHITAGLLQQVDTVCYRDIRGSFGFYQAPYTAHIQTHLKGELVPLRSTAMVHEWQHYLLYQLQGDAGDHIFDEDGSFVEHVKPWTDQHDQVCSSLR